VAVAAAVAPSVLADVFTPAQVATIGEYFNYCNFSSLPSSAIDELVDNCAIEMGYRAGESISELCNAVAGYKPVAFGA